MRGGRERSWFSVEVVRKGADALGRSLGRPRAEGMRMEMRRGWMCGIHRQKEEEEEDGGG